MMNGSNCILQFFLKSLPGKHYNIPGIYNVTLTATNSLGNDSLIKSCYIEVIEAVYVNEDGISPNEFILYQNYPNPFNPTTTISWQQPIESKVSITVYDILGNEFENIVDEVMPAGRHTINFSADQLPSGIYFYKIIAGNFVETKKMMLLK